MGFGRVVWSGCVGMLCLIPMAWISFSFLDLTGSVTGGLITNLNTALSSLGSLMQQVTRNLGLVPHFQGSHHFFPARSGVGAVEMTIDRFGHKYPPDIIIHLTASHRIHLRFCS